MASYTCEGKVNVTIKGSILHRVILKSCSSFTHRHLEAIKPFHLMGMFWVDLEKTQSVKADAITTRNKKKQLNSTYVSNNADFSNRL